MSSMLARRAASEGWNGSGQVPSCSQNAHDKNVLVRCAQWKINQPLSLKRRRASLEGSVISFAARNQDQPGHPLRASINRAAALPGEGVFRRARVGRVRSLAFLSSLLRPNPFLPFLL
jgi:hypothetical protein